MTDKQDLACISLPTAFGAGYVEYLRRIGDQAVFQPAAVDEEGSGIERRCAVAWLTAEDIMARVWNLLAMINDKYFGFELDGMEHLQYTLYRQGDYFSWHMDKGSDSPRPRKLSMTLQLSSPAEYEGGELELNTGSSFALAPNTLGSVVAFPSWILHQVRPVTKGERRSLVVWAGGPSFK